MSLTEREKEIALSCAKRGDLCVDEGCLVVSRGDVLDMFDDFLSRIREEQEKSYVKEVPDHCDRIVWKGRYYHLNNMPTDCLGLVEALRHLLHNAKASGCEMGLVIDVAEEALTNHAKRMKEKE